MSEYKGEKYARGYKIEKLERVVMGKNKKGLKY
jgi:hypothetical protein